MSDTPDRYPGQLTRVDAFAIAAMVLGVVALALSIPALLVASNARDKAQDAQDRARAAVTAGREATRPSGSSPTATTTTRPAMTSAMCPSTAGLGGTLSDHGTAPAPGASTKVQAGDFYFAPTCITQTPSGTVALVVHNRGSALHNVSVADQGIDRDVRAGKTITVRVQITSSPVSYFCKYHRTAGMLGALIPQS
jgi:plastocyanin